jgi:hypothetical protein
MADLSFKVTFCPLVSIFGVPVAPHPAVAVPLYKVVDETVSITTATLPRWVPEVEAQTVIPEINLVEVTGGA